MRIRKSLSVLLAFILALGAFAAAEPATKPAFRSYADIRKYISANQPKELDIGKVNYKPTDILKLKELMGEGSLIHFTSRWERLAFTEESTELDLNLVGRITKNEMEAILILCPNVRKVTLTKHYYIKNKDMEAFMTQYPDIDFVWMVSLGGRHRVSTESTAYSTMNEPSTEDKITSKDLEALKYVKHLQALDVGHNYITSLDFLQYCPDLELLIIGDNKGITDITPIGTLKHLQYLEMFSTSPDDIKALANCTELIDLNLSYCKKLTSLSDLDGLKKLERFWGNHMDSLDQAEKTRFAEVHPNTSYVFNGYHATSEGWREHERYDHYRECFWKNKWTPFE